MTTREPLARTVRRPARLALAMCANVVLVVGAVLLWLEASIGGIIVLALFPVFASVALGMARRAVGRGPRSGLAAWFDPIWFVATAALAACVALLIMVIRWPVAFGETVAGVLFFSTLYFMLEAEVREDRAAGDST